MLNSLYTEAIKKKGKLYEPLNELSNSKIDIDSKWYEEEIIPSNDNIILAAGDGSVNKKKYLSFNFYAVAAEVLIYNSEDEVSKLKSIESSEVDIILHQSFVDDRLRNIMSTFEIKTAIKTFGEYNIDYYLDDGSLLGDLIRPIPIEKSLSSEHKSYIVNKVKDRLQKEIESNEMKISSFDFKEEFKDLFNILCCSEDFRDNNVLGENYLTNDNLVENNNLMDEDISGNNNLTDNISLIQDNEFDDNLLTTNEELFKNKKSINQLNNIAEESLISFLENIEKLILLKYLLKNKEKIIAISKTSSSNDLFHANIPDMAILDNFTQKQGFSKPIHTDLSYKLKHDFPIENEFFRNLKFTTFFARLEDYKNIIKIELPFRANKNDIVKILSYLKKDSIGGYPYLLKKAHNDVVITNNDMTNLSGIIGFLDKTGREMLN